MALIENDFPARLYYVRLRNSLFDTHVNQESPHNRQVQYCCDAVWGFFEEMKRLGKQDEVAVFIHSEFGRRRVPENTSLGTDHGTANVSFVLGGGVKGGQYGKPVSLTDLVLGDNLQYTTDFRRVYASLIDEYLGYRKSEERARRQVRYARHVRVEWNVTNGVGFGQPRSHSWRVQSLLRFQPSRFRMLRSSATSSRSCGLPARCFMAIKSSMDATKNVR